MGISEIAVITGKDGLTVPLTGPGTVVIFRRAHGIWKRGRTFPFSLEPEKGLQGLRRKVAELGTFLGECRTFVARSANGAIYFELERARCHVWEIAGRPEEFLDSVCLEVKENGERDACTLAATTDAGIPVPLETAPGKFTLSIMDIQRKRSGVNSKQVLQQFIRRAGFTELEIICEHIPPWIGFEAEFLGIRIETGQSAPHEVRVLLKKPE
ncbi:Fe-only nitrogenase accessory AnfO family protein [Methanoregula sp.]|jgi:Fe-only nitrogenase accessory protein AnfO|uniref:Fe-only nitrogenase accessory AnfO family protein n=1 Tax=Methanoregula sp. TaxID=2052170 RepID=UPI003C223627